MLCKNCNIIFAFYLKYCRRCGRKLNESAGRISETVRFVSKGRSEVGDAASAYATSPLTLPISAKGRSAAEMIDQVLDAFPSIETTRLQQPLPCRNIAPSPREFSMEEFIRAEKTGGLRENFFEPLLEPTLVLPVSQVVETAPLDPSIAESSFGSVSCSIKSALCKDENSGKLSTSRSLKRTGARLHLQPAAQSGPVCRQSAERNPIPASNVFISESIAFVAYRFLTAARRSISTVLIKLVKIL